MIISKTPNRLSFLGGGTDFPNYFLQHEGLVVGSSINKYSYITTRFLPPFHDFKSRFVYRNIEEVNSLDEIQHKAIKESIKKLGMENYGLEISHISDLPGRSGTGSSSTFLVGLLNALSALKGKLMLPYELTQEAIDIEQNKMQENVGCQDQTFASYGGLNTIHFRKDGEICVYPLPINSSDIKELQSNLMLFFTKITRTSSDIVSSYKKDVVRQNFALMKLAREGVEYIIKKKWDRFGSCVDQSWRIKTQLSNAVTNEKINYLYNTARINGAFGGKIMGAGGGGCLFLVAPQEKHKKIIESIPEAIHIPFSFDFNGSKIIFSDKDNISEYRSK